MTVTFQRTDAPHNIETGINLLRKQKENGGA